MAARQPARIARQLYRGRARRTCMNPARNAEQEADAEAHWRRGWVAVARSDRRDRIFRCHVLPDLGAAEQMTVLLRAAARAGRCSADPVRRHRQSHRVGGPRRVRKIGMSALRLWLALAVIVGTVKIVQPVIAPGPRAPPAR